MDEFHNPKSQDEDEFQSTLHSAPSFAIYNSSHEDNDPEEILKRNVLIGQQSLEGIGSGEFSFVSKKMDLIEEEENENEKDLSIGVKNLSVEEEAVVEPHSPSMYLAAGLGVDGTANGFGGDSIEDMFTPNLQESEDLDEYYKRMVDEYPSHPFILKKYAKFLQSKGEVEGAEEYFYCATLADPNDGETLMQYAKLVWEHHHDKDKALLYFERAAQAAPQDSHVLAAYTSFLWETEDDENEGGNHEIQNDMEKQMTEIVKPSNETSEQVSPFSILEEADFSMADFSDDSNFEDYLKKIIDENPNNPLFLKKYAQFLFQSKRDLQAAEEYYSRAILADPNDGETISEYAKLEWELHHDQEKALLLFEQAVEASPDNSYVLSAYTYFLWETEDAES